MVPVLLQETHTIPVVPMAAMRLNRSGWRQVTLTVFYGVRSLVTYQCRVTVFPPEDEASRDR
jgi:hypothetical protein